MSRRDQNRRRIGGTILCTYILLLLLTYLTPFTSVNGNAPTDTSSSTSTSATTTHSPSPTTDSLSPSSSSSSSPSSSDHPLPTDTTNQLGLSETPSSETTTAEIIERLLLQAESARFGVPAASNTKISTNDEQSQQVRPSTYSYPQHPSLQHSIQADKLIDTATAMQLYEDAAALGSSRAFNDLGEMYLYGEGDLQANYTLAYSYFNASANMGNPEAQHNMAVMNHLGLNSAGKPDEAVAMIQDYFSAMGDNPLAKLSIGYRHMFGLNAPKSCEASVAYYQPVSEAVVEQSLASPIQLVIEKARLSEERSRSVPAEEDEDVIQYYQHSAENGDVHAQVALGQLHFYGARGFEQNPERAARYFKAAAAQGDASAMSSLGQMHLQGLGVPQNNETALHYLKLAAEEGNAAAENGLGYIYLHGQGVKQDYKTALKWFKKSAEHGFAEAQFNLGAMYFSGMGVDKKYAAALQYFTLAGQQGHTRAIFNLAQMHMNGLGTIKSCTIGVKLHKSVAERGNWATVCNEAHRNFLKGRYEQAWMQYARAAEEGYEVAQANSAWMLDMGYGTAALETVFNDADSSAPHNTSSNLRYRIAHRHWSMAAQQGHVDSLRMLGDYAFDGLVTGTPDYPAAMKYYHQAADQRNAQAMFNLGYMYEHGYGVSGPDYHLAKRFYDNSLEANPDALVPVRLAVAKLYAKSIWEALVGEDSQEKKTNLITPLTTSSTTTATSQSTTASTPTSTTTSSTSSPTSPPSQFQQFLLNSGLSDWYQQLAQADSFIDVLIALEDVILTLLCLALAIVVYYRSQQPQPQRR